MNASLKHLIFPLVLLATSANAESSYLEKLRAEVEKLRADVVGRRSEVEATLKAKENLELAKEEIVETKRAISEREDGIRDKEFLLSAYRKGYRIVSPLPRGHSFGTISYQGKLLQNCVFLGVNSNGVSLQTSSGMVTIPLTNVPQSLAGDFTLPSVGKELSFGFKQIYGTKPLILKTEGEIQRTTRVALAEIEEAGGNPTSSEPRSSDKSRVEDEAQLIRQRNADRMKEITELRIKSNSLFEERKKAKQDRYRQQQEFKRAKIKKSQSYIEKVMGELDTRIDSLEEKEREVKDRIERLRAAIE